MKKSDYHHFFSNLPSVDLILQQEEIRTKYPSLDREFLVYCIRDVLQKTRQEITKNPEGYKNTSRGKYTRIILKELDTKVHSLLRPGLHRVVNGTGVILHTGLGRAPLAAPVQQNLIKVMENYSNVEIDLTTGKRGERLQHVEEKLCYLCGSESAAVVNNNAGAVLIALNTLAKGKEVIISRGQLIEIGGSFRLPDVMEQSGAIVREIGTTNKTRVQDYQNAINEHTGAILMAHTSNYRIFGFTEEADAAELIPLAHKNKIPVIYDLGGGVFLDLKQYDLPHEPVVTENCRLGVDVVTFSGDKVLGGPQSGILAGKRKPIELIRKNPLMRALRCDKLILAALEETLKLYFEPEKKDQELPVFRMLLEPKEKQQGRAEKIIKSAKAAVSQSIQITIEEGNAEIGSGALPLEQIPSVVLRIASKERTDQEIAAHFRAGETPVIGYLRNGAFYLNLRTIRDDEIDIVVERLKTIL